MNESTRVRVYGARMYDSLAIYITAPVSTFDVMAEAAVALIAEAANEARKNTDYDKEPHPTVRLARLTELFCRILVARDDSMDGHTHTLSVPEATKLFYPLLDILYWAHKNCHHEDDRDVQRSLGHIIDALPAHGAATVELAVNIELTL